MKGGSLHTRSFERIHFTVFRYRWSKNGAFEKQAPGRLRVESLGLFQLLKWIFAPKISLAGKYRIVRTSSPWVSEDVVLQTYFFETMEYGIETLSNFCRVYPLRVHDEIPASNIFVDSFYFTVFVQVSRINDSILLTVIKSRLQNTLKWKWQFSQICPLYLKLFWHGVPK